MLILAFESSARPASAALVRDGRLLAQSLQCSALTHSRTLLPMAEDLLKNTGVKLEELDAIAVAHGPGSFTGIRIGVSTVKGLCWGAEKPCIGVSTLEAMAWHALAVGGLVCPVMDARRAQVYNAFLDAQALPCRVAPDDLVWQDAWGVAMAAQGKPLISGAELLPVYLRLSQAERERQARMEKPAG